MLGWKNLGIFAGQDKDFWDGRETIKKGQQKIKLLSSLATRLMCSLMFLFFRSRIEKVNYRQKEKQVLDSILGKGYDKRIRPSGKNDTGKKSHLILDSSNLDEVFPPKM